MGTHTAECFGGSEAASWTIILKVAEKQVALYNQLRIALNEQTLIFSLLSLLGFFFLSFQTAKDISLENAGIKPTDNSEGKITYELLKGLFTEVGLISISLRSSCTCYYHTNVILVGGLKIS